MTADEFIKVFLSGLLYTRSTDARSAFGIGEITEQYRWNIPEPWRDALLERLDEVPELRVERREGFFTTIIHVLGFPDNLDFGGHSFEDFLEIHRLDAAIYDEVVPHQRRDWRLELVPTSDRFVNLPLNSPERREVVQGLERILHELRYNNAIAEQLAEDRDRLTAELAAVRVGVDSESIRSSFIKDFVLQTLRELGSKLKDKALDLGIDRLIMLFEKIRDIWF